MTKMGDDNNKRERNRRQWKCSVRTEKRGSKFSISTGQLG